MPAGNAAQITAHQKANWDNHAYAYDEVLISKDLKDAATLQVISAIKSHKELVEGEQKPLKLEAKQIATSEHVQSFRFAALMTLAAFRGQDLRHRQQFWKTICASRQRVSKCICHIH